MAKEKRILDLEKTIKKHQDLYYNAQPEISDAEFDALWDELKALDPQNKLFFTESPSCFKILAVSRAFWCEPFSSPSAKAISRSSARCTATSVS